MSIDNTSAGDCKSKYECAGNIIRTPPDYLKDEPPYPASEIRCDKCGKVFTWKEYQAIKCDKLVEMMGKGKP